MNSNEETKSHLPIPVLLSLYKTNSDIVSKILSLQANFDTISKMLIEDSVIFTSCTFLASDKIDEGGGGGGGDDEMDEEEKERMAEDPSSYLPSFSDQMIRDTSSRRVWRCTICNYETTDGKKKGGQLGRARFSGLKRKYTIVRRAYGLCGVADRGLDSRGRSIRSAQTALHLAWAVQPDRARHLLNSSDLHPVIEGMRATSKQAQLSKYLKREVLLRVLWFNQKTRDWKRTHAIQFTIA